MTISAKAAERRRHWLAEIVQISGNFGQDTSRVEAKLKAEITRDGNQAILDHLHLCGSIPESYGHDSSEEKLYSKYTDVVVATALRAIGLKAIVLTERADAADVEAVAPTYSLVADAKAFRLSRTAKNQKDFKVEAMHGWKRDKPHALVVCPVYQLPAKSSQIYQQAILRNVTIFTYSHLAALVRYAEQTSSAKAMDSLLVAMKCSEDLNPTKDALDYWMALNRTLNAQTPSLKPLLAIEHAANLAALALARDEGLTLLAQEREAIMRLSHDEALTELIRGRNIDGRERTIQGLRDSGLLTRI